LPDHSKPIPHEPFPRFKATVANSSDVRFSLTVRKALRLQQVVQSHLAGLRVHIHQSSRLRQSETQTWQIQVFAKEPALRALQTQ
jgi:hypothetical protein